VTKFVLDTNVLSEIRRSRPHKAVSDWIASLSNEDMFVPAAVIGEIQRGIELTRRADQEKASEIELWLEDVIVTFNVIAMDADVFREWARLLHGKSKAIYEDAMIAATARVLGLTVATRNAADFRAFSVPIFNPFEFKG